MIMTAEKNKKSQAYILVIDDNPLLTTTLKRALAMEGYIVDTASDGHEGIRKAKSGFYHLILCDLHMPGLDGLMTIQHIQIFQREAGAGQSGFIVITAFGDEVNRSGASHLGVTDFLTKPFDLSEFLQIIDHHLEPLLRETPSEQVVEFNKKLDRYIEETYSKIRRERKKQAA